MTSQEVEVYEAPAAATLFGTDEPGEVVAKATAAAKPLAQVVDAQKLYATISGRKHVRVEGWCLLGSMLGVFPVTVWTRKTDTGWEARVEARTKHGEVVGAAEASCDRSEKTWASRDDYALRSMAQTRATSKALRQPLGFVMTLAGFDATPAEEMPRGQQQPERIEDAEFTGPDGDTYRVEGSGVERVPDPKPSSFQPPAGAAEAKPKGDITEPQRKMIFRLMKKISELEENTTEEALKGEILLAYGVSSSSELMRKEANEIITAWKKRAGEES